VSSGALTLVVPSGAVAAPVTVTVEGTTMISPPLGLMFVGPADELGPDGTQFEKPMPSTAHSSRQDQVPTF